VSSGRAPGDKAPAVHWVAAESLDAALRYMRSRNDDFTITEARFLGMIPCQAHRWTDRVLSVLENRTPEKLNPPPIEGECQPTGSPFEYRSGSQIGFRLRDSMGDSG